jgi:hypothetical protein
VFACSFYDTWHNSIQGLESVIADRPLFGSKVSKQWQKESVAEVVKPKRTVESLVLKVKDDEARSVGRVTMKRTPHGQNGGQSGEKRVKPTYASSFQLRIDVGSIQRWDRAPIRGTQGYPIKSTENEKKVLTVSRDFRILQTTVNLCNPW